MEGDNNNKDAFQLYWLPTLTLEHYDRRFL